jgi:nicotinate-nucleotide adenylyltransferase
LGIFGGTFDPPHVGHVAVARDVADVLGLERVLWVPAGDPPHKSGPLTSADIRLEMVRAAAASDPRFEVSTLEIDRGGPSYAVDTVRELRRRAPEAELFLILGADQLRSFTQWREPHEIVEHVRLAVMDRAGERGREVAPSMPLGDAVYVPVRRIDVSSTELRARRRKGADISADVPAGVHAIIERERLYSGR